MKNMTYILMLFTILLNVANASLVESAVTSGEIVSFKELSEGKTEIVIKLYLSKCHSTFVEKPVVDAYHYENKVQLIVDASEHYSDENIECIRNNERFITKKVNRGVESVNFELGFNK